MRSEYRESVFEELKELRDFDAEQDEKYIVPDESIELLLQNGYGLSSDAALAARKYGASIDSVDEFDFHAFDRNLSRRNFMYKSGVALVGGLLVTGADNAASIAAADTPTVEGYWDELVSTLIEDDPAYVVLDTGTETVDTDAITDRFTSLGAEYRFISEQPYLDDAFHLTFSSTTHGITTDGRTATLPLPGNERPENTVLQNMGELMGIKPVITPYIKDLDVMGKSPIRDALARFHILDFYGESKNSWNQVVKNYSS